MIYKTKSPKETQKIASLLAEKIKIKKTANTTRGALVVAMEGELGAGKTVFTQGFAKALKIKAKIKSPTFVLMKHYPIPDSGLRIKKTISNQQLTISNFYHLDCYRLKNYKDLLPLGIKEILKEPANIILVEWAERVKPILPRNCIKVHIDHIGSKERKITILPHC